LHGPLGEDGTVQGMLEVLGVPYVGSGVLGSSVAMDKAVSKELLAANGLGVAAWRTVRDVDRSTETAAALAEALGLPVFVKPANMGSSIGVSKATTVDAIDTALDEAFGYDEVAVVEEAVLGREIEVAVLGDVQPRASIPGEIVPSHDFYDYDDKYIVDGARLLVPAPLDDGESDEVRTLALEAFRALRCSGMARVDFFYEEGGRGFLVNEINTIPGFTPISMYPKLWEASGVGYAELIDELVQLALERHTRQSRYR
jgi:D-alanine-D-alanine ligase